MEYRPPFYQKQLYHIYNCGNGNEPIFRCDKNYEHFLHRYHAYMDPWWDTQAWCLLPDQFHFIVAVQASEMGTIDLTKHISKSFADFCNGYVQAFNKHHHRKGSLLRRAFKRCMIYKPDSIRNLVCYLHNQPVVSKLVDTPQSWYFSSYRKLAYSGKDAFEKHMLLRHFGNKREFLRLHKQQLGDGVLQIPYVTAA